MEWQTVDSMQENLLIVKGLSRYHIKYTGTGENGGEAGG